MQICGKFFYNIAVSRVQLSLSVPTDHYFIMCGIEEFKHLIFRVNSMLTGVECITYRPRLLDFTRCSANVMLNSELYCYFDSGDFEKISNIDSSSSRTQIELARPNNIGRYATLRSYKSATRAMGSFLFLTVMELNYLTKVSVYSVDKD